MGGMRMKPMYKEKMKCCENENWKLFKWIIKEHFDWRDNEQIQGNLLSVMAELETDNTIWKEIWRDENTDTEIYEEGALGNQCKEYFTGVSINGWHKDFTCNRIKGHSGPHQRVRGEISKSNEKRHYRKARYTEKEE